MQGVTLLVTRLQLLRYPFSLEARKASQKVAHDINKLIEVVEEKDGNYVIEEATERIISAIDNTEIKTVNTNDDRDLLIYTTARIIVEKLNNPRLKAIQAEGESKAANKHLSKENAEFVVDLASTSFKWEVEPIGTFGNRANLPHFLRNFDFKLRFDNFLEVAPSFHADEWKLVNRYLDDGWVPIRRSELDRLISGKFKDMILNSELKLPTLPSRLTEAVQRIESEIRSKFKSRAPTKITGTVVGAFPPCISMMYSDSIEGKNLSHEARFALAAFLLKIGMSEDEVLGVFRPAPDFRGQLAQYQVHHIARRGDGEGYTPPGCKKLQSNGLCPVYLGAIFDPLCEYVLHPLQFYETRAWEHSKDITNHSWYGRKGRKKKQNF